MDKKERKEKLETFSSKRAKERKKFKRKMMIWTASVLMGLSVIGGGLNLLLNHQSMAQNDNVASSKPKDASAEAILKGKAVKTSSDGSDKKIEAAKRAKKAIESAKAAKEHSQIEKGELLTKDKHKELLDKAVKEQSGKDKKTQDDLQSQIDDLNRQLKSSKSDNDDLNSKIASYKKQISDLQNQLSEAQSSSQSSQSSK